MLLSLILKKILDYVESCGLSFSQALKLSSSQALKLSSNNTQKYKFKASLIANKPFVIGTYLIFKIFSNKNKHNKQKVGC